MALRLARCHAAALEAVAHTAKAPREAPPTAAVAGREGLAPVKLRRLGDAEFHSLKT